MGVGSVSSSNEAYLQKLLAQQAQSERTADSQDSDSTDAVDTATQTGNYDVLELSGNSVSAANKALLGSDQGDYDSVDLSDEAQQYLNTQSASGQAAAAPASTDQTDDTDSTDSTDSTENLSLYTQEQLKKLLEEGEITQTDYNAEIARREAEEAQKEALEQTNQETAAVTD